MKRAGVEGKTSVTVQGVARTPIHDAGLRKLGAGGSGPRAAFGADGEDGTPKKKTKLWETGTQKSNPSVFATR